MPYASKSDIIRCIANEGTEFRNTGFFTLAGDRMRRFEVSFGATSKDGAFVEDE
jgi:hypothetical protein